MDILNQENNIEQPKGKKIVKILLILSCIAVVAIIAIMIYLEANKTIEDTLYINNKQVTITSDLIINDNKGNQYISIKELANLVNYEYFNNGYKEDEESTEQCHVRNMTFITNFIASTNTIYKYEENTDIDYQYYDLNCNLIQNNNKIYIALQDLPVALSLTYVKTKDNKIIINTSQNLWTKYQKELLEKGYKITEEPNNIKALTYGYIIANKNGAWGVLNTNYEEIIGTRYSTILFDEKNQNYIVSNNNGRYGIITKEGTIEQQLIYDSLEVLNYENMLYKVEFNNKYGILKSNGEMLTEIIYDEIGFPKNAERRTEYTLIIKKLDKMLDDAIVVKKNGKYGLVYLKTGEEFIPCNEIDKIYLIEILGEKVYKIEIGETQHNLKDYINYIQLIKNNQ